MVLVLILSHNASKSFFSKNVSRSQGVIANVATDSIIATNLVVENIFAKLKIGGIRFIYINLGLTKSQNRRFVVFEMLEYRGFITKKSADVCIMKSSVLIGENSIITYKGTKIFFYP